MSEQPDAHVGTYLAHTTLARCTDDGGCMLWTVNVNRFGLPVRKNKSLRRLMWTWQHGPLEAGVLIGVSCEHDNCLVHLVKTTKSKAGKKGNESIDVRRRRAKALQTYKRANSKLNIEQVREIRASGDSLSVLSDRYGVTKGLLSKIRLNRCWREASPFSGLGARQ